MKKLGHAAVIKKKSTVHEHKKILFELYCCCTVACLIQGFKMFEGWSLKWDFFPGFANSYLMKLAVG